MGLDKRQKMKNMSPVMTTEPMPGFVTGSRNLWGDFSELLVKHQTI